MSVKLDATELDDRLRSVQPKAFGIEMVYVPKIRLINNRYIAEKPNRAMNFITWDDGLAFADWAALRPMTELEFTKASRGTRKPANGRNCNCLS